MNSNATEFINRKFGISRLQRIVDKNASNSDSIRDQLTGTLLWHFSERQGTHRRTLLPTPGYISKTPESHKHEELSLPFFGVEHEQEAIEVLSRIRETTPKLQDQNFEQMLRKYRKEALEQVDASTLTATIIRNCSRGIGEPFIFSESVGYWTQNKEQTKELGEQIHAQFFPEYDIAHDSVKKKTSRNPDKGFTRHYFSITGDDLDFVMEIKDPKNAEFPSRISIKGDFEPGAVKHINTTLRRYYGLLSELKRAIQKTDDQVRAQLLNEQAWLPPELLQLRLGTLNAREYDPKDTYAPGDVIEKDLYRGGTFRGVVLDVDSSPTVGDTACVWFPLGRTRDKTPRQEVTIVHNYQE